MLRRITSILCASFLGLVVSTGSAHAAETSHGNSQPAPWNASAQRAEEDDWHVGVGGGVMYGPAYEGSDKHVVIPLPDVSVEYKNGMFFASVLDGIGTYPIMGETYKVGASIGFDLGRQESSDRHNLRGMGDIDMGATLNLMGEYDFGPVQLSGKLSKGTWEYGTTANVELGSMFSVAEGFMLMGSVGATWADDEHMQNYFGVSSSQSSRTGYKRYHAGAGIKSIGFAVGAFYGDEDWDAKLLFMGDHLVGIAADSPIVKDEFSPSVMLSVSYKFSF